MIIFYKERMQNLKNDKFIFMPKKIVLGSYLSRRSGSLHEWQLASSQRWPPNLVPSPSDNYFKII